MIIPHGPELVLRAGHPVNLGERRHLIVKLADVAAHNVVITAFHHGVMVDGRRGGDGRGLDGRLPLVRRYVRGTSPLPSPRALRRRTYCTSDAHNVCINPLVTRSSIMLDSIARETSHNPGRRCGRTPP